MPFTRSLDSIVSLRAGLCVSVAALMVVAMAGAATPAAAVEDDAALGRPGIQEDLTGGELTAGRSALGKFLAARHAEIEGDLAAAADLLAEVIQDYPDRDDILVRAQAIMTMEGRIEEAAALAERLAERDVPAPIAALTLATKAIKNGQYDEALGRLDEAGEAGPNRLLVPLLRGWTIAGTGDTDRALANLEPLAQSDALLTVEGLHAGLIADLGGAAQQAEAAFQRASQQGSVSLRVAEAYGSFLSRQGRFAEARRVIDEFRAGRPQDVLLSPAVTRLQAGEALDPVIVSASHGAAEAFYGVASLLSREGAGAGSAAFIRLALELRPGDPMYQLLLADILNNQGRPEDAIGAYRAVAANSPYAWAARLQVARLLESESKFDEAATLLQRMVEERPERIDAASALGDLLRFNERFEEAASAYDVAIGRHGEGDTPDWRLLYSRGIALERSKQWTRAEADFLRALELQPDQPHVLNYLGYSWVEQGTNLDQAKGMIERAVEQRPRDGFITDSLGWVLYRLGDMDGAVRHLERAVALEPGDPVINDHLGDAYWLVGRRMEAVNQWRRALDREPEPDLAETLRAKIGGRDRPNASDLPEGRDS